MEPEHTSNATYLDFKSEEQLLEIICIFNFDILFLKNQFTSTVSQHNLKMYGTAVAAEEEAHFGWGFR